MLAVEEDPILFENFRERAKRLRCLRYDYLQQFLPDKNIQQLEMVRLLGVFDFIPISACVPFYSGSVLRESH